MNHIPRRTNSLRVSEPLREKIFLAETQRRRGLPRNGTPFVFSVLFAFFVVKGFGYPSADTYSQFNGAATSGIITSGTMVTLGRLGNASTYGLTLGTGTSPYTAQVVLSDSGIHPGDLYSIPVSYPATAGTNAVSLQVFDSGTGGTLLHSSTSTGIAGSTVLRFVNVTGTGWSYSPEGAVLTRNLGAGVQAALGQPVNIGSGLVTGSALASGSAAYAGSAITSGSAALSGSSVISGSSTYAGIAVNSGTAGFLLHTGTGYAILTVTGTGAGAQALLNGNALAGASWPLVSTDGKLSFGSTAGTEAYIDDSGVAAFSGLFSGNNARALGSDYSLPFAMIGPYSAGLPPNYNCGFFGADTGFPNNPGVFFGIDTSDSPGSGNIQGTAIGAAIYNLTIQAQGGQLFVGSFTDDGSGDQFEVNGSMSVDGQLQLVNDSSTPTNSSTPAGYYHTKVNGANAWVPYYQ